MLIRQPLQIGDPDPLHVKMRFDPIRILISPIPQPDGRAESCLSLLGIDQ